MLGPGVSRGWQNASVSTDHSTDANDRRALSFLNLVEAHVLAAIRRQYHVPLPKVRQALTFVSKKLGADRPLACIERDTQGIPIRLFLFTRKDDIRDQPSSVVVDPRIAFGRPVLAGRSVPTAVLADRFKAGDTMTQLAEDYDTSPQYIEEALRCEFERQAA